MLYYDNSTLKITTSFKDRNHRIKQKYDILIIHIFYEYNNNKIQLIVVFMVNF